MDIFSALADENRRHIIELLATRGQLSATDISKRFPVSAPAISQHLKILKDANLVSMEKQAQMRLYKINPYGFSELDRWTQKIKKTWNERFDRLNAFLKNQKQKEVKKK